MDFSTVLYLWGMAIVAITHLSNIAATFLNGFVAILIPTLLGAFGGGYGAYFLQEKREKKDKLEAQIGLAIELVLALEEMFNDLSFAAFSSNHALRNKQMSMIQSRRDQIIELKSFPF